MHVTFFISFYLYANNYYAVSSLSIHTVQYIHILQLLHAHRSIELGDCWGCWVSLSSLFFSFIVCGEPKAGKIIEKKLLVCLQCRVIQNSKYILSSEFDKNNYIYIYIEQEGDGGVQLFPGYIGDPTKQKSSIMIVPPGPQMSLPNDNCAIDPAPYQQSQLQQTQPTNDKNSVRHIILFLILYIFKMFFLLTNEFRIRVVITPCNAAYAANASSKYLIVSCAVSNCSLITKLKTHRILNRTE